LRQLPKRHLLRRQDEDDGRWGHPVAESRVRHRARVDLALEAPNDDLLHARPLGRLQVGGLRKAHGIENLEQAAE
jgi:hypothetical protein